jgi:hypothetical protein
MSKTEYFIFNVTRFPTSKEDAVSEASGAIILAYKTTIRSQKSFYIILKLWSDDYKTGAMYVTFLIGFIHLDKASDKIHLGPNSNP